MKRTNIGQVEPYKLVSHLLDVSTRELEKATAVNSKDNANLVYLSGKVFAYKQMLGIILGNADVVLPIRDAIQIKEKKSETDTTFG